MPRSYEDVALEGLKIQMSPRPPDPAAPETKEQRSLSCCRGLLEGMLNEWGCIDECNNWGQPSHGTLAAVVP